MSLDSDACWAAFSARDRRFVGRFVAAVTSTGVYCRPGCPARLPGRARVRFYPHPAAAQADGFRPCLRCRPDAAPGTPAWVGTSATVARALRLIAGGALDGSPVDDLAARLGVGARHLTRLFHVHVGAAPGEVARTRRLHFARQLLEQTPLPIAQVAFASGFGSVRRFNEAFQAGFRRTPGELRRADRPPGASLALLLPYRPPLDWAAFRGFVGARALAGVERFEEDAYRRTFASGGVTGTVEVSPVPGRDALALVVEPAEPAVLLDLATRARRLFDLDADPHAIAAALGRDPLLAPLVARRPGLRVPGAWDPFETAVRAILGQQISVAAATTLAARLVARHGRRVEGARSGLTHAFPEPAALAEADPAGFGIPAARAEAIRALARAVATGALRIAAAESVDATVARLRELPGFGPWTAAYVAMRACGEPDAFPAGDLGVRRALGGGTPCSEATAERASEAWRPWRAYAAMHLWTSPSVPSTAPGSRSKSKDDVREPPASAAGVR
jgi:AraC family transcriptional regulator of adaptative response / DNA-3-methyladenine glycosylase II